MSIYSASAVISPRQCQYTTSSSRCFREITTATHDFEVADYHMTEGFGIGKFVCSSTFGAGGYNWEIRFCPDGNSTATAGNASAFLIYLSSAKDVRARCSLNVLERDGNA
jgi:speckle-type POZ protein